MSELVRLAYRPSYTRCCGVLANSIEIFPYQSVNGGLRLMQASQLTTAGTSSILVPYVAFPQRMRLQS